MTIILRVLLITINVPNINKDYQLINIVLQLIRTIFIFCKSIIINTTCYKINYFMCNI